MKKILTVLVALAVIAAGIYAGYRYRNEVYLPEKELTEDTEKMEEQLEELRPALPMKDGIPEDGEGLPETVTSEYENMIAWLTIPGTRIDYPVMYSGDNEYYLTHAFDGTDNVLGTPFLDMRCLPDLSGFTSIVYGHHFTQMRMFAGIFSYKDQTYMEQHDAGYLITGDGVRQVSFFAYLNVPKESPVYSTVFLTEDEKADYLDMLWSEAVYAVKYQPEDLIDKHLLLLSTCTYEFNDARGVLAGVIEDGNKQDE